MTILVLPRPTMCAVAREDIEADFEEYKRREVNLFIEVMGMRARLTKSWGHHAVHLRQVIQEKQSAMDMCRELQRCIRVELGLHDDA